MVDTQVNKSSPTNFELVFPKIPTESTISASEELTLNIYGSVIPGLTLDTTEEHWMGSSTQVPARATYEPWSVDFIVDSQFYNWKVLFEWLTSIHNNKDTYPGDPDDYKVDATLRVIDNFQDEILRVFFVDVWIQALSEIQFSHRESEVNLECNANFAYDRFEIRDW